MTTMQQTTGRTARPQTAEPGTAEPGCAEPGGVPVGDLANHPRIDRDGQSGQATAEYALVMLAAAGLAGSVLAWAVSTDAAGRLMDAVLDSVIGQVT